MKTFPLLFIPIVGSIILLAADSKREWKKAVLSSGYLCITFLIYHTIFWLWGFVSFLNWITPEGCGC